MADIMHITVENIWVWLCMVYLALALINYALMLFVVVLTSAGSIVAVERVPRVACTGI